MLLKDFKPLDRSVLLCSVYMVKGSVLRTINNNQNKEGVRSVGSYVVSFGKSVNADDRLDIININDIVMLNDKAYSAQFVYFDDNELSTKNVAKLNNKPDFTKEYLVKEYILINREEIVATVGRYNEVKSSILLN